MKLTDEVLQQAAIEVDEAILAQVDQEMDEKLLHELATPAKLTPSPGGKECLGNGDWPGYECQCPDCDYFLACFPDWKEYAQ